MMRDNTMENIEEEFKNNFCTYGSHFIIWKPETSPQKVLEWLKAIQVQAPVSPKNADEIEKILNPLFLKYAKQRPLPEGLYADLFDILKQ